jgi:uncharacterized protein YbjT (DUF2867 family)
VKVLVTGASGFLGHAVCAELRDRHHEVAALVRRPGSEPPGTSAVRGDLAEATALARVLESVLPARASLRPQQRDDPRGLTVA